MALIDFTTEAFSIDTERRTMRGVVVPWGKVGSHSNGNRWRFNRGSLKYGHPKFVRFNEDHDAMRGLGRAIAAEDTDEGLVMTFKVSPGPDGDNVLALAKKGRKTGLSVEVEIDPSDMEDDPENEATALVNLANLTAVGFVKDPAFDDSRLISVVANKEGKESGMPEETTETVTSAQPVTLSAEQFSQLMGRLSPEAGGEGPEVIDPTAGRSTVQVNEPLPYRFSAQGGTTNFAYGANGYDFSQDIFRGMNGDGEARRRVDAFLEAAFDTDRADVAALMPNPTIPSLYVDQMDYDYPLWNMVNKGGLPNGGQPFIIPKFNTSSGLVSAATEGTEPAPGAFTTTSQTITPTQVWGKAEVTRQTIRAGGNPAVSGLIWNQMLREYREDREAAVATFLATLTAATDIALPAGTGTNQAAVGKALEAAIASLNFVRGGNRFRGFAVHQDLYEDLAAAETDDGAPMYPILNPSNRNGESTTLFRFMNIAGVTAVGSWALGAGGATTSQNSWLFNPETVHGWADAPFRLDWNFGATVQTANIPQLSHVTIGIYGDIAFGNTDINGVRQVTYDPTAV
jgi:phage head maturation protease